MGAETLTSLEPMQLTLWFNAAPARIESPEVDMAMQTLRASRCFSLQLLWWAAGELAMHAMLVRHNPRPCLMWADLVLVHLHQSGAQKWRKHCRRCGTSL